MPYQLGYPNDTPSASMKKLPSCSCLRRIRQNFHAVSIEVVGTFDEGLGEERGDSYSRTSAISL